MGRWVNKNKPGRTPGRKNLKRTADGLLKNQHGVTFTPQDKKDLVNAVNRMHYKRAKMLKEADALPRKVAGKDTGDTVASLRLMGKENEFILAKRSKSLQRFQTREQFENYLAKTNYINENTDDYLIERMRDYKRNYMKAIDDAFGDEAKDIKMKIRMMKPQDYMQTVESDETLEISYVYDPAARNAKMNKIRKALGMKQKDSASDVTIK